MGKNSGLPEPVAMNVNETALYVNASEPWVRTRMKNGEIPYQKLGGRIFILKSDIDQILRNGFKVNV